MNVLEARAELIDALKSGKYPKARFSLRTKQGGYCCLGVVCDLSQDIAPWVQHRSGDWGFKRFKDSDGIELATITEPLRAKYGFEIDVTTDLMGLNDNNDTFEPVIEYLENLPVPV